MTYSEECQFQEDYCTQCAQYRHDSGLISPCPIKPMMDELDTPAVLRFILKQHLKARAREVIKVLVRKAIERALQEASNGS